MSSIEYAEDRGILTIRLTRPERRNSITVDMYAGMASAISAAQISASVRTVLILGSEAIFSAGNDVDDFVNDPPVTATAPAFGFLKTLASFTKPLVAGVCGAAVGVGATMLLHCDLVYASDDASFVLPFIDLGLCPEAGSALLIPQTLGYHKAAEALLLGDPIKADLALSLGLVNKLLPRLEVERFAHLQAARLAAKPLSGLLQTKRLMKAHQQSQLRAQMEDEITTFIQMVQGDAAREAFAAFSQKRKPDFSGL